MRLCAVFRAILRPAAVVLLPEFFLPPVVWVVVFEALPEVFAEPVCWAASCSASLGFIWMILRDLVGGGGNEKSSFVITDMAGWTGRFREF